MTDGHKKNVCFAILGLQPLPKNIYYIISESRGGGQHMHAWTSQLLDLTGQEAGRVKIC